MTEEDLKKWYEGKRVLVTGGAGFIGSHLAEHLVKSGSKVRIVDNLSQGNLNNIEDFASSVELVQLDLRNETGISAVLDQIDVVFHLAANASVPLSVKEPRYDFDNNVQVTFNLLDAIRSTRIESLVAASSGAIYGQPSRFPIVETEAIRPISPYGSSKAALEALCQSFHASYEVPVKIARVFNTYGPRQPRFVMYDFYRKLRQNPAQLKILGNGHQVRDYCHVTDTVNALMRLGMLPPDSCEAFNISSGKSYSIIEVAEKMTEVMSLSDVEFIFTGKSWAGDAQHWEVSIDKLSSVTGYEPQIDIQSGLQQFVTWFDAHFQRIFI